MPGKGKTTKTDKAFVVVVKVGGVVVPDKWRGKKGNQPIPAKSISGSERSAALRFLRIGASAPDVLRGAAVDCGPCLDGDRESAKAVIATSSIALTS